MTSSDRPSDSGRVLDAATSVNSADATAGNGDPRWFVSYALLKLDRAWRRLDPELREAHKAELADLLDGQAEQLTLRTFTSVGVRPDADMLLWRATPDFELLQQTMTEVLSTGLGAYLEITYLYTATTKPSQYAASARKAGFTRERPLDIVPIDRKYLIAYPMDKVRPWYSKSSEERGEAMREHAVVGRKYPGIKINTSYSFGIDDQEFFVAFETDSVHDFLDLMMELRGSEASKYTERDTPIFTCTRMGARETLDTLGGVANPAMLPTPLVTA